MEARPFSPFADSLTSVVLRLSVAWALLIDVCHVVNLLRSRDFLLTIRHSYGMATPHVSVLPFCAERSAGRQAANQWEVLYSPKLCRLSRIRKKGLPSDPRFQIIRTAPTS